MSRRKLRPEELDLWQRVARTADPLHPERPRPKMPFRETETPSAEEGRAPIPTFEVGEAAQGKSASGRTLPGLEDRRGAAPVRMDKKAHDRLRRGKLSPEGRIDLHGMTLDQAHTALTAFVMKSHARGRRLVLVITGKGKRNADDGPIPVRPGALRHAVPGWLQSAPLAQLVLQVSEAHPRHGGGGAYYVYLRRKR